MKKIVYFVQKCFFCYATYLLIAISLILSILSFVGHLRNDFLAVNDISLLIAAMWYVALILLILSAFIFWLKEKNKKLKYGYVELLIFFLILCICTIPRLLYIDHLGIFTDEMFWINEAKGFLNGTVISPFGFIGDQPSNLPALLVALLLIITKNVYYAVRLPGFLFSMGFLILLFFHVKKRMGFLIASLTSLLFATSIWDIHMSRFGWNNVNLNPFIIMGIIYFYIQIIDQRKKYHAIIAGIFIGIAINLLYVSMLMIVPIFIHMFLYVLLLFANKNKYKFEYLQLFVILLFSIAILIAPTFAKIKSHPNESIQRHKSFVSDNIEKSQKSTTKITFYSNEFYVAVQNFIPNYSKLETSMLWGITLNYTTFLALFLGFIGLFFVESKNNHKTFIYLSFFIMFMPVVILNRTTSVWREYAFLPTIYIFCAYGLFYMNVIFQKLTKFGSSMFVIIIIACIAFEFWQGYKKFVNNDLSNKNEYFETLCKEVSTYIIQSVPKTKIVTFPDQLCSDLTIVAMNESHAHLQRYIDQTPLFTNNEVVIFYSIPNQTPTYTMNEYDMDRIALEHAFRKIQIAKMGENQAYIYMK